MSTAVKSSRMDKLKMEVWDPGYFGHKLTQEVHRSPDCELVGVISRSPERGDELAQELGIDGVTVIAGPAEARAEGADTVIIALPQTLHRDSALAALEAGLHVLLEKPMAMTLD